MADQNGRRYLLRCLLTWFLLALAVLLCTLFLAFLQVHEYLPEPELPGSGVWLFRATIVLTLLFQAAFYRLERRAERQVWGYETPRRFQVDTPFVVAAAFIVFCGAWLAKLITSDATANAGWFTLDKYPNFDHTAYEALRQTVKRYQLSLCLVLLAILDAVRRTWVTFRNHKEES